MSWIGDAGPSFFVDGDVVATQFRRVQGGEELFRAAIRQMDRFKQKTELSISTERFRLFRERHFPRSQCPREE